jgi:hypothetical protein
MGAGGEDAAEAEGGAEACRGLADEAQPHAAITNGATGASRKKMRAAREDTSAART